MSILSKIVESTCIKANNVDLCVIFFSLVFNLLSADCDLSEVGAGKSKHKQSPINFSCS